MLIAEVLQVPVVKIREGNTLSTQDVLAVEEPLEIQLEYSSPTGRMVKNIAVTMRTPGQDADLAAGFLFTEGIISHQEVIETIYQPAKDENQIRVVLKENVVPVLGHASRNFYASSSCGICGKGSIDHIRTMATFAPEKNNFQVKSSLLFGLPDLLKLHQTVFKDTGGIHAAGLFDASGNLLFLREDIGRHNALDKIVGAAMAKNLLPLHKSILILSGRAGFELVQKSMMAGISIVAAIGAPSSLAVELAEEAGMTLIGFLRNKGMNIYTGKERIGLI